MSGPKRNPDKLNTIGVVVVGICGAVLVYVTIVALQAFYMNDTSEVQHKADFGDMDVTAKGKKADELRNISEPAANPGGNGTYRMKIEDAMKLVVADAKTDPSHLGGSKLPPSTKETIPPQFGRPKIGGDTAAPPAGGATPPAGGAAPAGAGSAAPAGAGSAAPAGAGSAAPAAPAGAGTGATGGAVIQTPTGAGAGGAAGASPARDAANPAAGSAQPVRRNP
jgi:hypothetical protein